MKSHDPPRLRNDPEAPALLRTALEVNVDEPSASDLSALGVSLGLAPISLLAPVAHQAHLGAKAAVGLKIKWISTIIAPALVGAATATTVLEVTEPLRHETQVQMPIESRSPTLSRRHAAETAQPNATPVPALPTASSPPAIIPMPRTSSTLKERSLPPSPPIAAVPDDPVPPLPAVTSESEIRLLEKAKALVDSDPRGALALVDEHAQRFSTGMLHQEAEVIAIEAMVRAGSIGAAADRLAKFRQRFPRSAYLPHLDSVMRKKN